MHTWQLISICGVLGGVLIGLFGAKFVGKRLQKPEPAPRPAPPTVQSVIQQLQQDLAELQHAHGLLHNRFQKLSGSFYGMQNKKGLGTEGDGWDGQEDFVGRLTSQQIVERARKQGVIK